MLSLISFSSQLLDLICTCDPAQRWRREISKKTSQLADGVHLSQGLALVTRAAPGGQQDLCGRLCALASHKLPTALFSLAFPSHGLESLHSLFSGPLALRWDSHLSKFWPMMVVEVSKRNFQKSFSKRTDSDITTLHFFISLLFSCLYVAMSLKPQQVTVGTNMRTKAIC